MLTFSMDNNIKNKFKLTITGSAFDDDNADARLL